MFKFITEFKIFYIISDTEHSAGVSNQLMQMSYFHERITFKS